MNERIKKNRNFNDEKRPYNLMNVVVVAADA